MEAIKSSFLDPRNELPLVVQPTEDGMDLALWATAEASWIKETLDRYGAILFRGFGLASIADMARVVARICPSLVNYFEGTSPRTMLGEAVYTSTEYPPEYVVSLHNEMSYAHKWPGKIFFFCHTEPQEGGQTPIADSHRVFEFVEPAVRQCFIDKGVRYVRNMHGGQGPGLSWQTVFETDDRARVETYCREGSIDFRWDDEGGLWTSQTRPAVVRHPVTGDQLWFNQAHNFHPSDLGEEEAEDLLEIFDEEELPNNAFYGDGSALELSSLREVRAAYDKATVVFPWRQGDLLLLDNMRVAHGRTPFKGPRKVLVAMAETVAVSQP